MQQMQQEIDEQKQAMENDMEERQAKIHAKHRIIDALLWAISDSDHESDSD
jgi:hypothetical protein